MLALDNGINLFFVVAAVLVSGHTRLYWAVPRSYEVLVTEFRALSILNIHSFPLDYLLSLSQFPAFLNSEQFLVA